MNPVLAGRFITIEGVEGAGKSTALQFIKNQLSHYDLVLTREPGGTEIAEQIRHLLLHANTKKEPIQPQTELLLMFAARAQHINQCIKPALAKGQWVISDRYIDASYAYQGYGRGLNLNFIQQLDKAIVGDFYPNLTLLMDIDVDLGIKRTEMRNQKKDRIEQEQSDFFNRIRQGYLSRAKENPQRIKIVDAHQSVENVCNQIRFILNEFVSEKQ
jgi:dTMP kinase